MFRVHEREEKALQLQMFLELASSDLQHFQMYNSINDCKTAAEMLNRHMYIHQEM